MPPLGITSNDYMNRRRPIVHDKANGMVIIPAAATVGGTCMRIIVAVAYLNHPAHEAHVQPVQWRWYRSIRFASCRRRRCGCGIPQEHPPGGDNRRSRRRYSIARGRARGGGRCIIIACIARRWRWFLGVVVMGSSDAEGGLRPWPSPPRRGYCRSRRRRRRGHGGNRRNRSRGPRWHCLGDLLVCLLHVVFVVLQYGHASAPPLTLTIGAS